MAGGTRVRKPSEREAEEIAINHVVHKLNQSDCYRKFNGNAVNILPQSVWPAAVCLFKHENVKLWISRVEEAQTLHIREQMLITMTEQVNKLEDAYRLAMETKQLGNAVAAIHRQNLLARLYDRDADAPPVIHELDFGITRRQAQEKLGLPYDDE